MTTHDESRSGWDTRGTLERRVQLAFVLAPGRRIRPGIALRLALDVRVASAIRFDQLFAKSGSA